MTTHKYTVFKNYPLSPGQKIRIEDSKRAGDWEVVSVTEGKVTLRCPISGKEFEWASFCYFVEDQDGSWPQEG